MKTHELMTIYPLDDEKSKNGAEDGRNTPASSSAELEKEEVNGIYMGDIIREEMTSDDVLLQ